MCVRMSLLLLFKALPFFSAAAYEGVRSAFPAVPRGALSLLCAETAGLLPKDIIASVLLFPLSGSSDLERARTSAFIEEVGNLASDEEEDAETGVDVPEETGVFIFERGIALFTSTALPLMTCSFSAHT